MYSPGIHTSAVSGSPYPTRVDNQLVIAEPAITRKIHVEPDPLPILISVLESVTLSGWPIAVDFVNGTFTYDAETNTFSKPNNIGGTSPHLISSSLPAGEVATWTIQSGDNGDMNASFPVLEATSLSDAVNVWEANPWQIFYNAGKISGKDGLTETITPNYS